MNLARRLRRQLSFANLVACLALFVALGGGAYAASKQVNGKYIVKHSIGANKLKNETITSKQIKPGTLNASVIDVASLGTVPSAQTAATAGSANTAASANTANSATRAGSAETATRATTAETADRATNADHATSADHAITADAATSADAATNAAHATSADEAETLDGETAAQLTVSCPAETQLFGGMCWDTQPRPLRSWVAASIECAEAGGRLPSLSELIAYIAQEGIQGATPHWSSDVTELSSEEQVLTAEEGGRGVSPGASLLKFRCLRYRAN